MNLPSFRVTQGQGPGPHRCQDGGWLDWLSTLFITLRVNGFFFFFEIMVTVLYAIPKGGIPCVFARRLNVLVPLTFLSNNISFI